MSVLSAPPLLSHSFRDHSRKGKEDVNDRSEFGEGGKHPILQERADHTVYTVLEYR